MCVVHASHIVGSAQTGALNQLAQSVACSVDRRLPALVYTQLPCLFKLLCVQVATMVRADWLFLLTDVPCLYTANPSVDPSAEPIHEVRDIAALQVTLKVSRLRQNAS